MSILSTRAHGILDYLLGAVLVLGPWLAGFGGGPETWVPVVLGLGAIGYSLFTDYELGLRRRIDVPVHLWLDGIGGLLLAASPWLFSFDSRVWIPHLLLGVLEMAAAFVTDTIPGYERRGGARTAAG